MAGSSSSQSQSAQLPAAAGGSLSLAGERPVNRLGFGAMRITGSGIWGPPRDRAEAIAVLRRAVELGVNFIDTADSYGPDVSEDLIAAALHPYPAGLVIATKGGLTRPGPDQWRRDGRPEHLRTACEGSLRRLRLECITVYQLHSPDPQVPYEDSVGALKRLQEEGKIRHIGISNVSVEQLRLAQSLVKVVSVQNRYNLLDRQSDAVIEACEREGIVFLPWAPLHPTAAGSARERIGQVGQRHGASASQVVLAWLLARSPMIVPIPGTSSLAHLQQNVEAARLRLSAEDVRELER